MNEPLFPSGPWTGFYNYRPGDRHRMELHLTFANGQLAGDGRDDIGAFLIRGRYDATTRECYWTKSYVGAHDVFYRGFREGKGIWGTWEIGIFGHGGFHIWPRQAGEGEAESEIAEQPEPVDAIATEVSVPTEVTSHIHPGAPQICPVLIPRPARAEVAHPARPAAYAGPRTSISRICSAFALSPSVSD